MNRTRNTNPSFFEILLGDFASHLVLPPRFTRLHRDCMDRNSKLRTGSGETWDVKIGLTGSMGELCFTRGWTKFVRDANLEPGEIIAFWFDRNESTFDVAVYGINCCQRAIQGRSSGSRSVYVSVDSTDDEAEIVGGDQEQDDTSDEISMEDEPSDAETDAVFDNTPDPKFNIKLKNCQKSRMPICKSFAEKVSAPSNYLKTTPSSSRITERNCSRVGDKLDKKRSKAYKQARDYWGKTNCAFSLIVFIRPAYLTSSLSIQKSIVEEYLPDPRKNNIKLRVAGRKIWKVNCLCSKTTAHISGGWQIFANDNKIKAGDACVIEVNESDHSIWDVTVFHS